MDLGILRVQKKLPFSNIFVLFQISDTRAGEGVSHKSLPHQKTKDRDGTPAVSHRETN